MSKDRRKIFIFNNFCLRAVNFSFFDQTGFNIFPCFGPNFFSFLSAELQMLRQ
jgi:hypothetical protein